MSILSDAITEEEFEELRTNGTKVNYWAVCPRKLWLFARGVRLEPLSDRVALGRLFHQQAYPEARRRELLIDNLIKIDLLESENKVLEVKYSRKLVDAARLQLAYYLLTCAASGSGNSWGSSGFPENAAGKN